MEMGSLSSKVSSDFCLWLINFCLLSLWLFGVKGDKGGDASEAENCGAAWLKASVWVLLI